MATSRTGTARWKQLSAQAKRQAQTNGQTQCLIPRCGVRLDYNQGLLPNSAEADHIIPHSSGGKDNIENIRIICRRCNQRLGGALGKRKSMKPKKPIHTKAIKHTDIW